MIGFIIYTTICHFFCYFVVLFAMGKPIQSTCVGCICLVFKINWNRQSEGFILTKDMAAALTGHWALSDKSSASKDKMEAKHTS